jgi:hypothetical protein
MQWLRKLDVCPGGSQIRLRQHGMFYLFHKKLAQRASFL